MLIELALGTIFVGLVEEIISGRRRERKLKLSVLNEGKALKAVGDLMSDNQEFRYLHDWSAGNEDIIYRSRSPISADTVVVSTSHCRKCHMVSRHIISGWQLAQERALDVEGFYLSGIHMVDTGCLIPDRLENLDFDT